MIKRLVLTLFLLGIVVVGGFGAYIFIQFQSMEVDTVGKVAFDRQLRIPDLAPSTVDSDGTRVFKLAIQQGRTDLGKEEKTRTWGVNGDFLGPTIRAERGEKVRIEAENTLDEETTLHWHGMHLPAKMDGGPHQMIAAGQTWKPHWTIDQKAASLWYHPHLHGKTAAHVYRGLAGMFLIDDPESSALPLPDTYGVDDIPLIVQDKNFNDGQFDEGHSFLVNVGVLGKEILVNGTPGPFLDVTTEAVRLRILNGSNARVFNLQFSDQRGFDVIASDGGLLEAPVSKSRLQVSPGERAEIVVRMKAGEKTVLRSEETDGSDNVFAGADARFDIMELRAAKDLSPSPDLPKRLTEMPAPDESKASVERSFELAGTTINGEPMKMSRVDETVTVGDTEIWTVRNRDDNHHNFHVHDVQFRILDIGGKAPPPEFAGWKDTVWVPGTKAVRLIMTFTDYTDRDSPYMYHCHLLRHEDEGMMGQFVVVRDGESAGSRDHGSHAAHH